MERQELVHERAREKGRGAGKTRIKGKSVVFSYCDAR